MTMPDTAFRRALQREVGPLYDEHPETVDGETVRVLVFLDQPFDAAMTLVTEGLAALGHNAATHEPLGEELLLSLNGEYFSEKLLDFFAKFLTVLVRDGEPLGRGDVVRLSSSIPGSSMSALYVCQPTYFSRALWQIVDDAGRERLVRWVFPIHRQEVDYIGRFGADAFEKLLEIQDPDVLDLQRPAVSLAP